MVNATMLAQKYFQKDKEGATRNPEVEPIGQVSLSQPPFPEDHLEIKTPLQEVPSEIRRHLNIIPDTVAVSKDMQEQGVSPSGIGHFQTSTKISFEDLKKKFSEKKRRSLNPKKGIDWFNLQKDAQGEREEVAREALAELEEDLQDLELAA